MTESLGVFVFVLVLLIVVMIHEAGHFFTAKAFRIKVEEFFIGFGPRLWSFRRGETEYGIKAIPAGGYVRIAGMNPFQETPPEDLPRTFGAKPPWQRAVVLLAGIQPGDEFVEVDGRPIRSYEEFVEYTRERAGQELRLVVARDGERVTLR